jgi:hypothetical protein
MPNDASHSLRVKLDQALELVMVQRGQAVIPISAGDTSMVPHLRGGDEVLVVPVTRGPVSGDLILFRQSDYWVVHRCLGPTTTKDGRTGYRTRGDGRGRLDPLVVAADVRARVIALRRGGTWRSLDGVPARVYAKLVAWHALFWAGAGVAAGTIGCAGACAAVDLGLLRIIVPVAFPVFHRRLGDPGRLIE